MEYAISSHMGINVFFNETDIRRYIPYVRALDYLKVFGENKLNSEELLELKMQIDSIKENDPKNVNKTGIVDFDIFMSKLLIKYRYIVNRCKIYVKNAFKAADLDNNGQCNLYEFILIYRYIENEKFEENRVLKIFQETADVIGENEKNLSFDKFATISVDYDLFSDEKQNKFLEIGQQDNVEQKINELHKDLLKNWNNIKFEFNKKLENLSSELIIELFNEWQSRLNALEINLQKEDMKKPTLIAEKIMKFELDRVFSENNKGEEKEIDSNVNIEE